MQPEAEFTIPKVSPTLNRMLYLYEGREMDLEGQQLTVNHCAELNGNEDIVLKNGTTESRLLLLEGEPIRESVATYGPFVMNTRNEIEQAIADYEATHFGGWQWYS
ncbi:pirin family protein, partial [Enterobacter roggenkampii]|nr:pirin family protein [Enterobacter roggenkampii]